MSQSSFTKQPSSLKHQIIHFVIIGLIATALDFVLYWWWKNHLTYSIAKILSFLSGSGFSYLLNKFFTFRTRRYSHQEIIKFMLLYGSTLAINVISNSLFIHLGQVFFPHLTQILPNLIIFSAYIAATGISTILNFLGQKFWVFTHQ